MSSYRITVHPHLVDRLIAADGRFYTAVTPRNSTVLGYPVRDSLRYWPGLIFQHAEFLDTNPAMVFLTGNYEAVRGQDPHLSVPWRHAEDSWIPIEDLGWYRVRCLYDKGDVLEWCPFHHGRVPAGEPDPRFEVTRVRSLRAIEVPETLCGIASSDWLWELSLRTIEPC